MKTLYIYLFVAGMVISLLLHGAEFHYDLDFKSNRLKNVAAPVDQMDAANKQYVDTQAGNACGWTDDGAIVRLTEADDDVRVGVSSGGPGKLYSETDGNYAVYGNAGTYYGVYGKAGRYGVYGNASYNAVYGRAENSYGVYGRAQGNIGIYGYSAANQGIYGRAQHNIGVYGNAGNYGVYGYAADREGVLGYAENAYGVYGYAGNELGICGYSGGDNGVFGYAARNVGVLGFADNRAIFGFAIQNIGVYGYASRNYGGYFSAGSYNALYCDGNMILNAGYSIRRPNGTFKAFEIDHPLDPENKVLRHFCMEGPEARVIYEGSTILNKQGEAIVEMPAYFDSLTRKVLVQLTPSGMAMPNLHCRSYGTNTLVISGGVGCGVVNWFVTAERDDALARLERKRRPVEQYKGTPGAPPKGLYLFHAVIK